MTRRLSFALIVAAVAASQAGPARFDLSLRDITGGSPFKVSIAAHLPGLDLGLTF